MAKEIPRNFLVLGRGYDTFTDSENNHHYRLSRASMARVNALTRFYFEHRRAREGLIVCSGGYAGQAFGQKPIPGISEGKLMADELVRRGILGARIEGDSDSTFANYRLTKEAGYFERASIAPDDPLGIVASWLHYMRAGRLAVASFERPRDCFRLIPSGEWYARDAVTESIGAVATATSLRQARDRNTGQVNMAKAEEDFNNRHRRFIGGNVLALFDKSRVA